jgi:general secretion pathway protein K
MSRRKGFALIAALWFVVLLSGLALEFSLAARDVRVSSINAQEEAKARAAAEAGIDHARALLNDALRVSAFRTQARTTPVGSGSGDPWRNLAMMMPDTIKMGDQRYAVSLRDAGASLNVNIGSEDELRRLFAALRIDSRLADRFAQSISDWKDADDLHRARGAELDGYLSADAPILPSNGRLRDVREIRWLLGMTPSLYARIAPSLSTVGSGRINLRSASRPVLLALPGMTEEAVAWVLRVRRDAWRPLDLGSIHQLLSASAKAVMLPHLPMLVARTVSSTSEVEVQSAGWSENGRVHSQASALVVRAGDEMITSGRQVR